MRSIRLLVILALVDLLSQAGCGTIIDTFSLIERDDVIGPRIYGGVRFDVESVGGADKDAALIAIICILDLPLSLGLDTVFLPASLLNELVINGD
jgi:uncharacterized protein YceK